MASLGSDGSSHFEMFQSYLGGLQMLKCSEQSIEGRHSNVAKIVKRCPHHSPALLSSETRFAEMEADIDANPQDPSSTAQAKQTAV